LGWEDAICQATSHHSPSIHLCIRSESYLLKYSLNGPIPSHLFPYPFPRSFSPFHFQHNN
jgi:hypothetical protein